MVKKLHTEGSIPVGTAKVDNLKNPQLAIVDQILAIPTLARKLPLPARRRIGDLSNTERVLIGLDLVLRE